jgi:hypothetical protein
MEGRWSKGATLSPNVWAPRPCISRVIQRPRLSARARHQLIGNLMGISDRPEIALNMPCYTVSKGRLAGFQRIPNDGSPDTRGTG